MTTRTDPMFYDIEIQELKTQQINTAQVGCWWSGDASANGLRALCDCQLAGYFYAQPYREGDKTHWRNAHRMAQWNYLQSHRCDHTPSRKFRAVRARLPTDEVVELAA